MQSTSLPLALRVYASARFCRASSAPLCNADAGSGCEAAAGLGQAPISIRSNEIAAVCRLDACSQSVGAARCGPGRRREPARPLSLPLAVYPRFLFVVFPRRRLSCAAEIENPEDCCCCCMIQGCVYRLYRRALMRASSTRSQCLPTALRTWPMLACIFMFF